MINLLRNTSLPVRFTRAYWCR